MRRIFAICLSVLLTLPVAAREPIDAQGILTKAKAAAGGSSWDSLRSLHLRGKIKVMGFDGTLEEWSDLSTLRFARQAQTTLGRAEQGFDGKSLWTKLPFGPLQAVTDSPISLAYRKTYAYWFPKRWEAQLTALGLQQESNRTFQAVQVSPKEGQPFQLWFDASTYLLDRVILQNGKVITYADYRSVGGVKIAFAVRSPDEEMAIDSAEWNVPLDEKLFQQPAVGLRNRH
jgi:hypothetical protein